MNRLVDHALSDVAAVPAKLAVKGNEVAAELIHFMIIGVILSGVKYLQHLSAGASDRGDGGVRGDDDVLLVKRTRSPWAIIGLD